MLTGTRYNVYRSDPQTHKSVPDSLLTVVALLLALAIGGAT
eukprot:COSAG02_NODE_38585_length_427_cov_1.000000_1_plen_40_part_10